MGNGDSKNGRRLYQGRLTGKDGWNRDHSNPQSEPDAWASPESGQKGSLGVSGTEVWFDRSDPQDTLEAAIYVYDTLTNSPWNVKPINQGAIVMAPVDSSGINRAAKTEGQPIYVEVRQIPHATKKGYVQFTVYEIIDGQRREIITGPWSRLNPQTQQEKRWNKLHEFARERRDPETLAVPQSFAKPLTINIQGQPRTLRAGNIWAEGQYIHIRFQQENNRDACTIQFLWPSGGAKDFVTAMRREPGQFLQKLQKAIQKAEADPKLSFQQTFDRGSGL